MKHLRKKSKVFIFLTKSPKHKENCIKKILSGGEKLVKVSSSLFCGTLLFFAICWQLLLHKAQVFKEQCGIFAILGQNFNPILMLKTRPILD